MLAPELELGSELELVSGLGASVEAACVLTDAGAPEVTPCWASGAAEWPVAVANWPSRVRPRPRRGRAFRRRDVVGRGAMWRLTRIRGSVLGMPLVNPVGAAGLFERLADSVGPARRGAGAALIISAAAEATITATATPISDRVRIGGRYATALGVTGWVPAPDASG